MNKFMASVAFIVGVAMMVVGIVKSSQPGQGNWSAHIFVGVMMVMLSYIISKGK
jgi:cytosine/uracil/thiamine/allantoin permease